MENWEDIHEDFKYYQQLWEKQGLTYQEAQEWISVGLKSADYGFASHLKQNNLTPEQYSNYKNQTTQEQLDYFYPNKSQAEWINLKHLNFNQPNELIISDYPNLKKIEEYNIPSLTQLTITNCLQLEWINIWDSNNLQQLNLNNLPKLKKIDCDNNNLNQDLSFLSGLVNLKTLWLNNNPLYGNLEYLKDMNKLETLAINDTDIDSGLEYLPESLKEFYCLANERKEAKVKAIYNLFANEQGKVETDSWGIKNFPQKLQEYKQKIEPWKNLSFTSEEIGQWINAGAKLDDYKFVAWFRDTKKLGPEWITNYQEDYQILSERFKKYGLCEECNQLNTGEQWCQACNAHRLKDNFTKWTSHNPQVDEFIQKYQLAATDADKLLEWIPYKQFTEIKYLAEGGFGKVYKAKWKKGPIEKWEKRSFLKDKWKKKGEQEVVLKILNNSQENTDFLQETAKHKDIDDWFNNLVPCYGLSQDPATKNYLMVMQYMPEGNLRHYLGNKNKELTLEDKLSQLVNISRGLKDLHQKNLVHRDFHSGNILKGIAKTSCLITDLGLCKPANETSKEDKIFGVMPYVAPEVLQSQPYTQASDIYSFGIVAYEMLTGLPPYYERAHDLYLAIEICQGLRPKVNIKIPQLLEGLIKQCWDKNPLKRPTANELERILRSWEKGEREFTQQIQEAEEFNKTLPDNIKFPDYQKKMHTGAVYTSKLLPTKEITQLLINNQLQTKTIELNNYLMKTQQLAKEIINLENLAKTEQKKRNDLKKALTLAFEKSDELEKIIADHQLLISEEMKEMLGKIKELKHKSQTKDSKSQKLKEKKSQLEEELRNLKNNIIANKELTDEDDLGEIEEMLKAQIEFIKNNDFDRLRLSKKRLVKMKIINEKEINDLCQLQAEITQLAIQLEEATNQGEKQLTQIINNIGSINVNQGSVLIDNTFGDSTNISSIYAKSIEETQVQALQIQPPYGTPGSSKPK